MGRLTALHETIAARGTGIAAGLASVVGAGLIAVPAAVYHETGSAALLTWAVAALICVPMIMLFRDTVLAARDASDPLRDTIRAGLGPRVAAMVPLMFGMVVTVGLPAGAVMAARNLSAITDIGLPEVGVAAAILGFAALVTVRGRSLGNTVERIGTAVLVLALIGVVVWSLSHPSRSPEIVPDAPSLALVPAGVLVAFWAFIGFENLTFLARELPDPRRDFAPVAMTALVLLLMLVIALTLATMVQSAVVDPVTGVVDAVRSTPFGRLAAAALAIAAVLGMTLNAVAWVRGVAYVLDSAGREYALPSLLTSRSPVPRRAVVLLCGGFTVSCTVLALRPDLVVDMLAGASGVFVIIYLLCILAYIRTAGLRVWSAANLALVPLFTWTLIASGSRAILPVAVLTAAAAVVWLRSRGRAADADRSAPASSVR
ncbi:APC family permease [Brevibacterium casei]|uniref:Amino acid permease n=1 Tax=Brevibacterium casei TaxID=33889 RepID=A0A7T2TGJ7_9MICO|nr:amino acid permease [Brevibacterium casei]QPS33497.1 amino acid permease [Brevibacterium casei]